MLNLKKLCNILIIFAFSQSSFNAYSKAPIAKLQDFNIIYKKNKIVLAWKTNFEENTKGFKLEKSFDGVNFEKITFEKAKGQYSSGAYYEIIDATNSKNATAYRLTEISASNHEVILKTINPTAISEDFEIQILNDEIKDTLKFVCIAEKKGDAILRILNEKKEVILIEQPAMKKGENSFSLDISWIPVGTYVLKIVAEKQEIVTQFSKK